MNDNSASEVKRLIVISDDGKISFSGKWKVGELLRAAQLLADIANNIEVESAPTET